jgi:hypothetical protein
MVKHMQAGEVEGRRPCSNGCAGCGCRRAEEGEESGLMTESEQRHDRVVAALDHEPLERMIAEAQTVLDTRHSTWREVPR